MIPAAWLIATLALAPQDPWTEFRKLAGDKDPDRRARAIELVRPLKDLPMARALLPLLADEHPRVRLRAAAALAAADEPALHYILEVGAKCSSPLARQSVCDLLGRRADPRALPFLLDRLTDGDSRVRGAAAASLGRLQDPASADRLLQALRREGDWPLRAFGLEALERIAPDRLSEFLPEAARDRHSPVRQVAAAVAGRTGLPDLLAPLVEDRDWRVRVAALEACLDLRRPEAIGWLIERLGRETGRLRWDLVQALHDLTGKDLGLEAKPWKAWWDVNQETFQPRPRGGKGGPDLGTTQASFFQIPILSTRILFVLDLSGSMRDPAPAAARPPGGTKLDAAKAGLLETIRALQPETRFGILGLGCDEDGAYRDRARKTWQGRLCLLPASPPVKADAERFVRGLEARGWTNLFDGLDAALEDPDVDTVYLYSDGGASKGTFVAASEILSQLAERNRFRRVVVHAVEIPGEKNPPDNRRLLEEIARQTKGQFRPYERR
jgi:HEAT repeat protein